MLDVIQMPELAWFVFVGSRAPRKKKVKTPQKIGACSDRTTSGQEASIHPTHAQGVQRPNSNQTVPDGVFVSFASAFWRRFQKRVVYAFCQRRCTVQVSELIIHEV